jgi:hypothetical protein
MAYCEDSGWLRGRNDGRGVIVTSGFCRVLSEAHDRVVEKLKKDPNYLNRLREMLKLTGQPESQLPASTMASSSVLPECVDVIPAVARRSAGHSSAAHLEHAPTHAGKGNQAYRIGVPTKP